MEQLKKAKNMCRLVLVLLFLHTTVCAQRGLGTNTPHTSAILELQSTTKGFLMPRLTSSEINSIPDPAEGLMVYCTDEKTIFIRDDGAWRMYYRKDQIENHHLIVVDPIGNVGIGTVPSAPLTVKADNDSYALRLIGDATSYISFMSSSDSSHFGSISGSSDGLDFSTGTSLDKHMHINANGNVGIGTSSPVGKMSIITGDATSPNDEIGNVTAWDETFVTIGSASNLIAGNLGLGYSNDHGSVLLSLSPGAAWKDMSYVAEQHIFKRGSNEHMRIDSSGKVIIKGDLQVDGMLNNTLSSATIGAETIESGNIKDGTIMNVDVNAAAAIAGTKINPDFGGQDVFTTGNVNSTNMNLSGELNLTNSNHAQLKIETTDTTDKVAGIIYKASDMQWKVGAGYGVDQSTFSFYNDVDNEVMMVIKKEGNVGIGTTNPQNALSVTGYDKITLGFPALSGGESRSGIRPTVAGGGYGGLQFLVGGTNGAEATTLALQLSPDGNVGIGGTPDTSDITAKLLVENSSGTVLRIKDATDLYSNIHFADSEHNYPGFVSYNHGTNYLTLGTNEIERMRIDANGNVGIGGTPDTSDIIAKLLVENSSGTVLRIKDATDLYSNIHFADSEHNYPGFVSYNHGTNYLTLGTNEIERMRIDANGNVGIGTNPVSAVSIKRPANAYIEIAGNDNDVGGTSMLVGQNNRSVGYCWNRAAAPLLFGTDDEERIRIDSDGNVGIGTQVPRAKLTISKDLLNNTDASAFRLNADATNTSNTLFGGASSSLNYAFWQSWKEGGDAGARSLVLNPSGGNVGIGASSSGSKLYVDGKLTVEGDILVSDGNALQFTANDLGTANSVGMRRGATGELVLVSNSGGLFHEAGDSYYLINTDGGATSDATLKENIVPIDNALEKVLAIGGVYFNFKEKQLSAPSNGRQIGVIAQNVESVFPEAVVEQDGIKHVRYETLIAPLFEAFKELKQQNESQQAVIENLMKRLKVLEAKNKE